MAPFLLAPRVVVVVWGLLVSLVSLPLALAHCSKPDCTRGHAACALARAAAKCRSLAPHSRVWLQGCGAPQPALRSLPLIDIHPTPHPPVPLFCLRPPLSRRRSYRTAKALLQDDARWTVSFTLW